MSSKRRYSVIEAPLFVGNGLAGTERLPKALLDLGLASAIGATVVDGPGPMTWNGKIDATTTSPDFAKIRDYSLKIAQAVERELAAGAFPIVLGGDCTVLLGCAAACRRQRVAGLLFLDGHTDFSEPGVPEYETASMDLFLVTGRGPKELAEIDPGHRAFRDENVVLYGFRDDEFVARYGGGKPRETGIHCISLADIRSRGFGNTVARALKTVETAGDRFWIHLDLDVIDDASISAVDYRMPDGLAIGEVVEILRRALLTGKAAGLNVTILNPTLDWDGSQSRRVVDMLGTALRSNH